MDIEWCSDMISLHLASACTVLYPFVPFCTRRASSEVLFCVIKHSTQRNPLLIVHCHKYHLFGEKDLNYHLISGNIQTTKAKGKQKMNATTVKKIEEMKKQTIGVEVEMNNITRSRAAAVAARYFGTGRYESTSYRNGYKTWSAYDADGREWKFMRDSSIAGPDDERCELVTPILTYSDIETLQELIRQLRHAGAKSDASRGCGVHIHIGAKGHTPDSIRNLVNIMASHEDLISEALQLDADRIRHYCQMVDSRFLRAINVRKPSSFSSLADIWYSSQDADWDRDQHYNDSRYHMLNLHATFTKGTIEFRLFQFDKPSADRKGGLHAGQLKSYIQFCLALSQMAKDSKKASAKPQQHENPKFAMRTWLIRLGFVGDEFSTARDFLTRNLSGDAAFRFGR